MNKPDDIDPMLATVMQSASDPEFRQAQLDLLLLGVRQRNRFIRWRRRATTSLALILPLLTALWLWQSRAPSQAISSAPHTIRIVETTPDQTPRIVRSSLDSVEVISSSAVSIRQITTALQQPFLREIEDEEFTGLLAGYSGALIRRGPNDAEVVFASAIEPNAN